MEGWGREGLDGPFRTMHIAVYCLCSFIFIHHPRVYCKVTLTFYMLILHDTGECILSNDGGYQNKHRLLVLDSWVKTIVQIRNSSHKAVVDWINAEVLESNDT